ncbi:MAG TPA: type VI secretion system tube protein Hcp [Planctomycetota bacterium]|nr:type VI secretion system tube protein Hcp [Planctomycetota bacterium]
MAVDMFLSIEDKKIKGESRDKAHKDEIDVLSWSWGMSQSGSMHSGGGGGSGKVSVQDLSLTKYVDKASADLVKACCSGTHYKNAKLVVRKAGGSPLEYLIITMEGVLVAAVSTGGSGGEDRLTESVTLNFGKVKVQYQPQKEDGTKDGGVLEAGWDIAENVSF